MAKKQKQKKAEPEMPQKRPVGKPPLGDNARKMGLHVRVTIKELTLWKELAEQNGQSLSDFVMAPIRKKHPAK